ncbi:hypothetical protein [Mycolicibacterium komossense]|jgi:hypothetical protein|uniref:Uncharacterized protein n=1 Tax=Mycolicibacterium komossense TaxID=1779 RepID=A0ABT3CGC4_9MYCO|nr:hypothetical protein [Mycolicibacterium komossense]MCV7228546.1 hypothetical protein [Mycolicibacterium komossense]
MNTNWLRRLARSLRDALASLRSTDMYFDDADSRRMRSDLDAIRARFQDHA